MHLKLFLVALLALSVSAAEGDAANLRLRFPQNEGLRYVWTLKSTSQSSGRERGQPFTLTKSNTTAMTMLLKGLPPKGEGTPVSLRLQDFTYSEKRSIGPDSAVELTASKGHIKYTENGKVLVDSDNDIGVEQLANFQQHIKSLENADLRAVLDPAGRQMEMQSDNALVEGIKKLSQGIFPILAGKEVKEGETWEDSFKIPALGEDFKLARPALVRSKMTFAKWVEKDGVRLAQIELVSAWEKQDLKGENATGLLMEFSNIDGRSIGTCFFDPAKGQFTEGAIESELKYRLDGELNGETTGLDVTGKTVSTFAVKK